MRPLGKEIGGEYLLHDRSYLRKGQAGVCPEPFRLQKVVRDSGEHHVMMPARKRPTFEVVEPQFGLERLILLFDGPPLMSEPHDLLQRQGGQVHEVILGLRRVAGILLDQQPDFGPNADDASREPASREWLYS